MKRSILGLILVLYITKGYNQTTYIGVTETDTIYSSSDLHLYTGQKVTLQGLVINSKIPTLNGVDIQNEKVRGKQIEASGILVKTVISDEDLDPYAANRGAGTFYHLDREEIKVISD